jgi:hypothetical protein
MSPTRPTLEFRPRYLSDLSILSDAVIPTKVLFFTQMSDHLCNRMLPPALLRQGEVNVWNRIEQNRIYLVYTYYQHGGWVVGG